MVNYWGKHEMKQCMWEAHNGEHKNSGLRSRDQQIRMIVLE